MTFKIGDEVTVGGPGTSAFMPRGIAHAWKNTGLETGRALFVFTPGAAGKIFEDLNRERRPLSSMVIVRLQKSSLAMVGRSLDRHHSKRLRRIGS